MTPRTLFTWLARAEAVTWTLLLIGMWLKYLTRATDLGVRVFGLAHGVVFLAFLLVVLVLWVDQRWRLADAASRSSPGSSPSRRCGSSAGSSAAGWPAALAARARWRRRSHACPSASWRRPSPVRPLALVAAVVAVGLTTVALLVVGPPPVPGNGA